MGVGWPRSAELMADRMLFFGELDGMSLLKRVRRYKRWNEFQDLTYISIRNRFFADEDVDIDFLR